MGQALWRLTDTAPADEPPDGTVCRPMRAGWRYRIEVFGVPRSPWRTSMDAAMADAVRLDLASWDGSRNEHYLAVPVDMAVLSPAGGLAK